MAIKQKYMLGTTGNQQIDYNLRSIYDFLNEIVEHLNATEAINKPSAPEGTLRIVKQSDNTYIVEVKGKDVVLVSDASGTYPTGFRPKTTLD